MARTAMGQRWEGKLKDMAMSKAAAKKMAAPVPATTNGASKAPRYPWGLSVNLDDASLKALGLKTMPPVGSELTLQAKCCVTSSSERHEKGGSASRDASLQITHMAVAPARTSRAGKSTVSAKRR